MRGRHPLHVVKCRWQECPGRFVWLMSRKKDGTAWVPVDEASLSEDDVARLQDMGKDAGVEYDRERHVSHYKTCLKPEQFSKTKAKPVEKNPPPPKAQQRSLFAPPRRARSWD